MIQKMACLGWQSVRGSLLLLLGSILPRALLRQH
jgi:hypothetical protein